MSYEQMIASMEKAGEAVKRFCRSMAAALAPVARLAASIRISRDWERKERRMLKAVARSLRNQPGPWIGGQPAGGMGGSTNRKRNKHGRVGVR